MIPELIGAKVKSVEEFPIEDSFIKITFDDGSYMIVDSVSYITKDSKNRYYIEGDVITKEEIGER